MSRRIDIELTSVQPDGSWTWRAAGARVPKGVLDGNILPEGAKVGDEVKVEVQQEIDGITVLSVVQGRQKVDKRDVLELVGDDQPFEPVIQQLAGRDRRDDRDRRGRRPRRDGDNRRRDRDGGDRPDRGQRGERGDRERGNRHERDDRRGGGDRRDRRDRSRPNFTPPPEVPQRPKPKRLRPGKARRAEVLAGLPEEQRPIAELALQGMGAVRQRLREDNRRLADEGKATMPEASVLKLAEELLPRLRVAEWLDRAEAAQRQIEHLDLRDLRSVVAAAEDPIVARDEHAREIATELKSALATKQTEELDLWYADIDAALAVGRVIRALRLSSQPPKAGVPFPPDLAQRLSASANAALAPSDGAERWIGVLEAAAFSPVRSMILPIVIPDPVPDDLRATVTRLAPALPHVATAFGIEVAPDAPMPKPLRPTAKARPTKAKAKAQAKAQATPTPRDSPAPTTDAEPPPAADTAPPEPDTTDTPDTDTEPPPAADTAPPEPDTTDTTDTDTEPPPAADTAPPEPPAAEVTAADPPSAAAHSAPEPAQEPDQRTDG